MSTVKLTTEDFKKKVFDYTDATDWKFEGDKPAIIDFYADWCGPCRMVAPVMDELAKEYAGKIDIYKVDTQAESELAMVFGIMSIPSVLYVPVKGKPMMQTGAYPKNAYQQVIEEQLLAPAN